MSTFERVRAEKQALRLESRRVRAAIVEQRGAELAVALAAHGIGFLDPLRGTVVSAFCSMPDELDTGPLLHRLHDAGLRICLPVMQGKGKPLAFRAWAPGDDMNVVTWGIREPKTDKPVLEPQILLVPLLAFDRHGWRLGYGGGFYDRTLRAARAERSIVAVGIGLDEVEVDAVPHLDYDERLDWALTPSGPRRLADS
ncbi:MAG: 5-formyltetrahydrofolate cyclo-ligase [Bacteroidota bacterium]